MRETLWKGSLTFGLVDIQVVLRPAETRDELSFTMLDRRDLSPVGMRKINKTTGRDVPSKEIVKGYERKKGGYVVLTDDDLRRAGHERADRIEIGAFVDVSDIDWAYFERPYYLEPAAKSEKPYVLFREALRRTHKAGIATIILHNHERLAAIVPRENVLMLEILRFEHQLRAPSDLHATAANVRNMHVTDAELTMAERLIQDLSTRWRPEEFRDRYREELLSAIEQKARTGEVEAAPEPEKPEKWHPPADIMDLLKRSVSQAEGGRPRGHHGRHLH